MMWNLDFITISAKDPNTFKDQLLDAFHKGQIVVIEELNTHVDETLLNALLSGFVMKAGKQYKDV